MDDQELINLFHSSDDVIRDIQKSLRAKLESYKLDAQRKETCDDWISDSYTTFRFMRKHDFNQEKALKDLVQNLKLRINHTPHLDLESHYITNPILCFLPICDHLGRPVAVLNCKYILRDESEEPLAAVKDIITGWWELGRRYLRDISTPQKPILQFILLASAEGAGYANMEHELISFFLSALHAQFPGQCGTTYITHMHWTAGTLWGVVQNLLPAAALDRIQKPNQQELFDIFGDADKTPTQFGGHLEVDWDADNDELLKKYAPTDSEVLSIASDVSETESGTSQSNTLEHSASDIESVE